MQPLLSASFGLMAVMLGHRHLKSDMAVEHGSFIIEVVVLVT
jgi:hypothetical protein